MWIKDKIWNLAFDSKTQESYMIVVYQNLLHSLKNLEPEKLNDKEPYYLGEVFNRIQSEKMNDYGVLTSLNFLDSFNEINSLDEIIGDQSNALKLTGLFHSVFTSTSDKNRERYLAIIYKLLSKVKDLSINQLKETTITIDSRGGGQEIKSIFDLLMETLPEPMVLDYLPIHIHFINLLKSLEGFDEKVLTEATVFGGYYQDDGQPKKVAIPLLSWLVTSLFTMKHRNEAEVMSSFELISKFTNGLTFEQIQNLSVKAPHFVPRPVGDTIDFEKPISLMEIFFTLTEISSFPPKYKKEVFKIISKSIENSIIKQNGEDAFKQTPKDKTLLQSKLKELENQLERDALQTEAIEGALQQIIDDYKQNTILQRNLEEKRKIKAPKTSENISKEKRGKFYKENVKELNLSNIDDLLKASEIYLTWDNVFENNVLSEKILDDEKLKDKEYRTKLAQVFLNLGLSFDVLVKAQQIGNSSNLLSCILGITRDFKDLNEPLVKMFNNLEDVSLEKVLAYFSVTTMNKLFAKTYKEAALNTSKRRIYNLILSKIENLSLKQYLKEKSEWGQSYLYFALNSILFVHPNISMPYVKLISSFKDFTWKNATKKLPDEYEKSSGLKINIYPGDNILDILASVIETDDSVEKRIMLYDLISNIKDLDWKYLINGGKINVNNNAVVFDNLFEWILYRLKQEDAEEAKLALVSILNNAKGYNSDIFITSFSYSELTKLITELELEGFLNTAKELSDITKNFDFTGSVIFFDFLINAMLAVEVPSLPDNYAKDVFKNIINTLPLENLWKDEKYFNYIFTETEKEIKNGTKTLSAINLIDKVDSITIKEFITTQNNNIQELLEAAINDPAKDYYWAVIYKILS
ncbi:MAG: hypothetical protein ACD_79C00930G0001, partial [uncultured bacterium]